MAQFRAMAGRLPAPRGLRVKRVGPGGVTLAWRPPRGAKPAGYLVFRDGRRIARTERRSYTDTRAKPGRHRYAVVALDAKGRRGRPSKIVRARMPARAPSPFTPAAPAGPDPPPLPAPDVGPTLTAAMVDRLFWRAGFGATPDQRAAWTGRGHRELVDWLLDTPTSHAPTATPPLTGGSTPNQPIDPLASEDELVMEWLDRMQRAVNPLRERLAFFWHRHWAVSRDDGIPARWLVAYRNRMLRFADPAQSFRALAYEMSTLDAAMSMYLNGNQNVKGRPNENYARELMELFCLGPKAPDGSDNYAQADVEGLARALTGWRLNSDEASPDYGKVTFSPAHFEPGAKTFLGRTLPALGRAANAGDGPAAVGAALDAVLGHPSHAQYLIRKLWAEFIATPIPPDALAALVAAYRPDGPLRPVLRGILAHPLIFESLDEPNLVKPPVVYLVGVLRQLGAPMKGNYMTGALTNMQQRPYRPPNVAGWEGGMAWLNTNTVQGRFDAVLRAQFLKYSNNSNSYPRAQLVEVDTVPNESAPALVDRVHASVGRPWLAEGTRAALLAYASAAPVDTPQRRRQRFYTVQALMLGGPDGQVM
jgi:uncharacterized protein (DUF1800 family)